jgi:hypothetical protein
MKKFSRKDAKAQSLPDSNLLCGFLCVFTPLREIISFGLNPAQNEVC